MTDSRTRGARAEAQARAYLETQGLRLLAANYHCRGGELDLVMADGDDVVFVEVRQRAGTRYGTAAETIGPRKRQRLHLAASHFLQTHGWHDRPCRFDVVTLTGTAHPALQWIRAAFEV